MCLCSCEYKCWWKSEKGIGSSRVGLTEIHNLMWVLRTEFRSSANNYVPKILHFMLFYRKIGDYFIILFYIPSIILASHQPQV